LWAVSRDSQVTVDLATLADAALPVVEVVAVAAFGDGDLADAFDLHVACVAGRSSAGVAVAWVLFAGPGWKRFWVRIGYRLHKSFHNQLPTS